MELLLVMVYGYIAYSVFKYNHSKINYSKNISEYVENSSLDSKHIVNLIKKLNKKISVENIYLTGLVPISIIGVCIFYIYLNSTSFMIMSFITLLILVSFSAVKQNYVKSFRKINRLV